MINFNDPFTGFMIVLLVILGLTAYLAFFGKVEEDKKQKRR